MLLTKNNIDELAHWLGEAREGAGGVVLIDKDKEWTSFDVVGKLRGALKIKKIGHAGTLDPLATGLLIVACGKATKQIDNYQAQSKKYSATLKLGATTKTLDAEGEEEEITDISGVDSARIESAVKLFKGPISQMPPMYSARKVNGRRLYELARKNIEVEVQPRQIEIYDIAIKEIKLPFVIIDVHCSKGTYIRSLARDIGKELGTGAYLADLRREGIGCHAAEEALRVQDLCEAVRLLNIEKSS